MLAPTRYACPCGRRVLVVTGPEWSAWDLAAVVAEEHGRECPRAGERWDAEEPGD